MNLKKAFVFVLLAFLLINAVSATEDSIARDDTGIIAQQSLDEYVPENGLDSENGIAALSDSETDITNSITAESDISPITAETDMVNSIDSKTEDIGEGSDSHNDINISFDEQMYEKDLGEINVDLGDEVNGEFCILIDEEVIYNETITDSHFKVPVVLPKKSYYELIVNIWPGIDCRRYKVNAFLNGEDLNINKTLQVMKLPPDYSYLHFQDEVLTTNDHQIFVFPRSANGIVEIWLDGVLLNKTKAQPIIYFNKLNLTLGNHSWKVLFYNDTYYNDFNATANFSAVNVKIQIPQILNITHDDCISVESIYKGGTVKTYIDGMLINTSKVEDKYFVLCLEQYLKKDSHEVKVIYENGKVKREKTQSISIVYDFDLLSEYFIYGEDNIIEIILPDTLNNKLLTVEINGTKYAFKRPAYAGNNFIEINISKLQAGNYSMHISYAGDDRFEAKDEIINFTVNYNIISPDYVEYKDTSFVYLNLPEDAHGNLVVYMDDKLFGNVTLKNGYAKIRVDTLLPGFHSMKVGYSGDDYEVEEYETLIHAAGRMTVSYSFTAGQNKYVVYDMPESSGGYVVFTINGKEHKVNVKNGKAMYSLKNLKAGDYEICIDYYRNGELISGDYADIEVKKSKIKIISYKMSSKSIKVKIKLNKPMKTTVYAKFMGKTYKIKTNSKGIGTFKKSLKIKKSKKSIKFSHLGSKLTKKLYKPNLKVTKSKKKMTLKTIVNIKGIKVRFKAGKKTYTVKTNSRGIAKISMKKPKNSKVLCKAIYFGCKVSKNVRL